MPSVISATSWGSGRLDIFATVLVIGSNERIHHKFFDGSWGPGGINNSWEDIGGVPGVGLGFPAAVSWGPGRLDTFAPGQDGRMHHKFFDGSWGPGGINNSWEDIGGGPRVTPIGVPAAVSWAPGRVDIFAEQDGRVCHKFFDGSWGPGGINNSWEDIGGGGGVLLNGTPAAVSWGPGRLDTFAPGRDGRMYHKFFDGSWGPEGISNSWEDIGGGPGVRLVGSPASPAAVSWGPGRVDIFAPGEDGRMYHKFFDGSWGPGGINSSWEDIGGGPEVRLFGTPAAVSWGPGRLDVFALGVDSRMYHKFFDGSWGPGGINNSWEDIGGGPGVGRLLDGTPAAVSWGPRRLDIFAQGEDGRMYHKFFDGSWGPGGIHNSWEFVGVGS